MRIARIGKGDVAGLIPYPDPNANKYTRGKMIFIGGGEKYPGASCLATSAAMKCGAGYVEAYCEGATVGVLRSYNPNIVVGDWRDFSVSSARLDVAEKSHPKSCLIGSGIDPKNAEAAPSLFGLLESAVCPIVVDGGAIEALAGRQGASISTKRAGGIQSLVITPHYGEAARLAEPLDIEVPANPFAHIQDDAEFALRLSRDYGATIVLKGPSTLIAQYEEGTEPEVLLMDIGSACLAKAGTGDVLAGMTASFLAQGLTTVHASMLATYTHALSADIAQEELTGVCVCATDVIDFIPRAIKALGQ